jgi:hypothetical protein
MTKRYWLLAAMPAVFFAGVSFAQFPILDMIAGKVVEKYQQSSCEQLWIKKGEPKSPQVQEAVARLRADPAMRTEFINRVAGPIANKMFECGMIP